MNRQEYIAFVKERALAELNAQGDETIRIANALASFIGDLSNGSETRNHVAIEMGTLQVMGGFIKTPEDMKRFIEGIN